MKFSEKDKVNWNHDIFLEDFFRGEKKIFLHTQYSFGLLLFCLFCQNGICITENLKTPVKYK